MHRSAVRLITADRACLGGLCLLLALSLSMRAYTYQDASTGSELTDEAATVDLGQGVVLPRTEDISRTILAPTCSRPIAVDFVDPSPHGTDASLVASHNPNDRVLYVYKGWSVEGPLAVMKLSMLHFAHRSATVLRLNPTSVRKELALKLTIPAGCAATPEDAIVALRSR